MLIRIMDVRVRPRNRGRRLKKVLPPLCTSSQKMMAEDEEDDLVAHKVYLTVDCHALFQQQPENSYNHVRVPIQMSKADQSMYPQIYEAFKAAKVDDLDPRLEIVFKTHWRPPTPLIHGADLELRSLNSTVDLKLKQSTFLKRLQNDHRFNISVNVSGYVYRVNFRRGRHIPLTLDNSMIALKVGKDGSSAEERSKMCPGLFGRPLLHGKFTVLLKWYGPDLAFNCLPMYKKLVEEFPKDVSIIVEDGQIFETHSSLLKASSPVLTAMLESSMTEGLTKEIQMRDVDAEALQTFIKFLTEGTFLGAFENCDTCAQLFMLSHKYNVTVLENATKTLLEVKPIDWFETEPLLELLPFVKVLPGAERLYDRVKSILKSREGEVRELNKKLLQKYSSLLN